MDQHSALYKYFGHTAFRPGQETLVNAILAGRDAMGIMPTGGGKSLCYQIPALLLPGVTLVISPLISLMKDQVAALQGNGVDAAFLNSSLSPEEFQTTCREIRRSGCKLVYIAPERLENKGFLELIRELDIALVAVDEAHCISQWGQDFRPSYLRISHFVENLPRRPVLAAFTATATQEVRGDIVRLLGLNEPTVVVTGFDRPNLFFDVRRPMHKLTALRAVLEKCSGQSGIIYCATRSGVGKVCDMLNAEGFSATRYHAGLSDEERQKNQADFQFDQKLIMVATNAFGMGIDKSNVSFVIHYNMPKSLEAYYQEAGRAGRDGAPAQCVLLYSPGDVQTAKFLVEHSAVGNENVDPESLALIREQDHRRLSSMVGYCKTSGCLRNYILNYFGQKTSSACGNCGNCKGLCIETDITMPAQMILSCVRRVYAKLGYYVGTALIVRTLRGSKDRRIGELGLEKLSTFGLLKEVPRKTVNQYVDRLVELGYLFVESAHSTLRPTQKAADVLFHGEKVMLMTRAGEEREERPRRRKGERASLPSQTEQVDDSLLSALKATRTRLAQEEGIPAYIVFSNATLADMAERMPRTIEEFLEVSGVGEVKAKRYGDIFLQMISDYIERRNTDA